MFSEAAVNRLRFCQEVLKWSGERLAGERIAHTFFEVGARYPVYLPASPAILHELLNRELRPDYARLLGGLLQIALESLVDVQEVFSVVTGLVKY
jgi:hypothetical protein